MKVVKMSILGQSRRFSVNYSFLGADTETFFSLLIFVYNSGQDRFRSCFVLFCGQAVQLLLCLCSVIVMQKLGIYKACTAGCTMSKPVSYATITEQFILVQKEYIFATFPRISRDEEKNGALVGGIASLTSQSIELF